LHALGTHLLVDLKDCQNDKLNDIQFVQEAMLSAARDAQATIVDFKFHEFSPFGISGVVVIAESHLAIHTWPEYKYAAVDVFTCGDTLQPEVAAISLAKAFESRNPSIHEVKRGIIGIDNIHRPHKSEDAGKTPTSKETLPGEETVDHERASDFEVVY
jgi:S-adenosylmethionine decarboxylase